MSEISKWYVVHTYSGYENKVATNIEKIVANSTPGIPKKLTNIKDKIRLINISRVAHFFVSLNNPFEVIYVVVGNFIVKTNKSIEKHIAIKLVVDIAFSYQILIK